MLVADFFDPENNPGTGEANSPTAAAGTQRAKSIAADTATAGLSDRRNSSADKPRLSRSLAIDAVGLLGNMVGGALFIGGLYLAPFALRFLIG